MSFFFCMFSRRTKRDRWDYWSRESFADPLTSQFFIDNRKDRSDHWPGLIVCTIRAYLFHRMWSERKLIIQQLGLHQSMNQPGLNAAVKNTIGRMFLLNELSELGSLKYYSDPSIVVRLGIKVRVKIFLGCKTFEKNFPRVCRKFRWTENRDGL